MADFRGGFQLGAQAGGFGKFFETLGVEIDKSQKRREEEDIRRRKEDLERKKEEFLLKGAIEKIRTTGEEQRKTQAEKAKREAPFKTRPLTLEEGQREAGKTLGFPITVGPEKRGFITGQAEPEDEAVVEPGGGVTTSRLLSNIGIRPGEARITGEGRLTFPETKGFKAFQLTADREAEFKQSVKNGIAAIGSVTNPTTGEPFTNEEVFNSLVSEFPGQSTRLRSILRLGTLRGEEEDFGTLLFGE